MAFDRRFLEELNARCDIVDVVSRYVELKKSGSNYFGLCPFHNEKTASFSVSQDKQIYHCFGCGAGGGAISFIMKLEGLEYPDAVRFLAKQYNLTVKEDNENAEHRQTRERILTLCKDAARFFYYELQKPENANVKKYFLLRGLSNRTINNFGLGYAPDSFNVLMNEMLKNGYTKRELFNAGLVGRSEKGHYYDKFRNRVMFPIIDIRGNVIAFGGRVMDESKPKYLNSPETIVFNKSRNLFALNIARKTKNDYFVLAEGYMDVIAMHQAGFDSAVASLGTSLTDEQARLISRHTSNIIIAYDADEAGQKASQRAIDILKKTGVNVKVLRIPGAKDPDQFIKEQGPDAFRRLLEKSENHIEYRIEGIKAKYDLDEDEQRVGFIRDTANEIARLNNAVEREVYSGRVASVVGISKSAVDIEVKAAIRRKRQKEKKSIKREIRAPALAVQPKMRELRYDDIKSARAEEGIIGLIFADNTLMGKILAEVKEDTFTAPVLAKIYKKAVELYENEVLITASAFEEDLNDEEMSLLASILSKPHSTFASEKALADYICIINTQKAKRSDINSIEDPLEKLTRNYREKMGVGGDKE